MNPTHQRTPATDCTPPTVSIGMPVYNGGKYIREALESLVTQTWTDFELIISDNASTDDTQAICKEYTQRDQRIRYYCQEQNQGALANFQFVLDKAKGPYFMWAAADDRWDNRWVELMLFAIGKQSDVATFGDLVHIDAYSMNYPHPATAAVLQFAGKALARKLAFFLAYEGSGKANLFYALYSRSTLQRIRLSDYSYDYQILFALLDHVAYLHAPGLCLYKRIHDQPREETLRNAKPIDIFTPLRVLRQDWKIAMHYFQCAELGLKLLLTLFLPLKMLLAFLYHLRHKSTLLCSRLRAR